MQRLRSGDVTQIRENGRNYVVLGRSITRTGEQRVLLAKSGAIRYDGKVREFPRGTSAKVWSVNPSSIKRIHGHRTIDLDSIRSSIPRLSRVLIAMNGANGILTTAPNINQVANDVSALGNN